MNRYTDKRAELLILLAEVLAETGKALAAIPAAGKITDEEVRAIRERALIGGETGKALAAEFGVSRALYEIFGYARLLTSGDSCWAVEL